MNPDLQMFQTELLACLPLNQAEEIGPAAVELDKMPMRLAAMVIDATKEFDELMPTSMTREEKRELRRQISYFCKCVFSGDWDIFWAETDEELRQIEQTENNLQAERTFAVLDMGKQSWDELTQDSDHDLQWDMLGLGELNIEQRQRLYRHIRAILEVAEKYELDQKQILVMIGDVEIARTAQRVYWRIQRVLADIAEFYEDCTDWNGRNDDG